MPPKTVDKTALGVASIRALETDRADGDRLFEDPFAIGFLPLSQRIAGQLLKVPVLGDALLGLRERYVPGVFGSLVCRTKFLDDAFKDALADGFEQIVILGAGFDTRAHRVPGADRTRVFEVDQPATQAWKQDRIERMHDKFASPPSHVTYVPIDFEKDDLAKAMDGAEFRTAAKTFFIWEGVTQYIAAEAVDATLRYISSGARGNRVAFTYVRRGILDGSFEIEGRQMLLDWMEKRGNPWVFGIDPAELSDYLAARGFRLLEDIGATDYRTRYLDPTGRTMNVFDAERVAVAEVAGV